MSPERARVSFTDHLPGDAARALIASQHLELRRLLATAVGHAFAFENGQRIAQEPLRALLGPLREAFADRVSEDALGRYSIEDEPPFGAQLTEHLRREHVRQLLSDLAREDLALLMSRRPRATG